MTAVGPATSFSVMAKPAGARCNLDCAYCFYLEKQALYPDVRAPRMADDVLERYIRRYIASQPGNRVTFAWQGGEPTLLGTGYFRRVVALQRKHAGGKIVENAFQTNGVLLDDDWCGLFKEAGFLVGLSIDGPKDLHDACRVTVGGRGSFRHVMRGLELLKKHHVEFNTLTALHRGNADDPSRVYRFLKDIGSRYQQYIPIAERTGAAGTEAGLTLVSPDFPGAAAVADWSLTADQYGRFLVALFDEWVRRDVGRIFVQLFDSTLSRWTGRDAEICVFQETCGRCPAIEHNGDVFACDHYVYPDHRLGNIMEAELEDLVFSPRQAAFGSAKAETLPARCRACTVRPLCNGGCPKHRFAVDADGEPGLNHFCAAYRRFFVHTAPYMRFMADQLRHGRPPANVMAWARARSRGGSAHKVGRNAPCPCGSGMKFKKCCGGDVRRH